MIHFNFFLGDGKTKICKYDMIMFRSNSSTFWEFICSSLKVILEVLLFYYHDRSKLVYSCMKRLLFSGRPLRTEVVAYMCLVKRESRLSGIV